jgi:hypothetical protein
VVLGIVSLRDVFFPVLLKILDWETLLNTLGDAIISGDLKQSSRTTHTCAQKIITGKQWKEGEICMP